MFGKKVLVNSSTSTFDSENFHQLMIEIDEHNQESISGGAREESPVQLDVIRLDHNKTNTLAAGL
jgi:hypothetical protein